MIRPVVSDSLDFEGEMAVILKSGGRHIPRVNALDCVAGYSIFNDGSVREYQFKAPQWTVGKNFDGTGAFGPALVTADEVPEGGKGLKLETRLNGKTVQSANTDDMLFDVAALISIISEAIALEAGDVIVSGTPAGIGWARAETDHARRRRVRSGDRRTRRAEQYRTGRGAATLSTRDGPNIREAEQTGAHRSTQEQT